MPLVTLREESKRQTNFYVPRYEIKIAGANLPLDVLRDVTQITYKDGIKELDSFEITVNNWDAVSRDFKYVGSETEESLKENPPDPHKHNPLHRLFVPCRHEVEVRMGYSDDLKLMLKGNFTTMEPSFPSGGGPTLTVRGLNVLHKLRTKQHTYAWPPKTKISEIAKSFETLPDPEHRGKKRFSLPIEIDENALATEEPIDYVAQSNQYDIDFLLSLARRIGYVVFIKEEEKKGVKQSRLYFGPSDATRPGLRPPTFELKWGLSLIDFKPTLTTANQIRSVTVNGWNRAAKKSITGKASLDNPKLKLNRDLHELLAKCDAREERVVDEPVFTQKQADARAKAILLDRSKDIIKVSGTCIGLPELRAGRQLLIGNIGAIFSGEYFITETTHTINDGGYITKFNGRRETQAK